MHGRPGINLPAAAAQNQAGNPQGIQPAPRFTGRRHEASSSTQRSAGGCARVDCSGAGSGRLMPGRRNTSGSLGAGRARLAPCAGRVACLCSCCGCRRCCCCFACCACWHTSGTACRCCSRRGCCAWAGGGGAAAATAVLLPGLAPALLLREPAGAAGAAGNRTSAVSAAVPSWLCRLSAERACTSRLVPWACCCRTTKMGWGLAAHE